MTSLTKLYISPKPVTITFVNFSVSGLISIRQMPEPLLPLWFTPSLFQLSRLQQIELSCSYCCYCHVTPILRSLHWLRITERIEYKLLLLTYKVLSTT